LRLILIFHGNKSVFLVKCPCAEISQQSSKLISYTSFQRAEHCYGNQVYKTNFMHMATSLYFVGLLNTLCILSCSCLMIMQLYIRSFEKYSNMDVFYHVEYSFTPATSNRASEFQRFENSFSGLKLDLKFVQKNSRYSHPVLIKCKCYLYL